MEIKINEEGNKIHIIITVDGKVLYEENTSDKFKIAAIILKFLTEDDRSKLKDNLEKTKEQLKTGMKKVWINLREAVDAKLKTKEK